MGRRNKSWWVVIKSRHRSNKYDVTKPKEDAPIVSIQKAPIAADGGKIPVALTIWELDTFLRKRRVVREGTADDRIAKFYGTVMKEGRGKRARFYFKPNDGEGQKVAVFPLGHRRPGPTISLVFETAKGSYSDPFEITLAGDDLEDEQWELGWEIRPLPLDDSGLRLAESVEPMSRSSLPIRVPSYSSGAAMHKTKAQVLSEIKEMSLAVNKYRDRWFEVAEKAGEAYFNAHKNFTDTIEAQNNRDALYAHMAFAVLGGVSAGALSYLSSFAQNAPRVLKKGRSIGSKYVKAEWKDANTQMFIEIVEDNTQVIAGKAIETLEMYREQRKLAVPTVTIEPWNYSARMKARLRRDFGDLSDYLHDLYRKYNAMKESEFAPDDVRKMKKIKEEFYRGTGTKGRRFHVATYPKNVNYFPTSDSSKRTRGNGNYNLQDEIEIGIWARYFKANTKYYGSTYEGYAFSLGSLIRDRLDLIGISGKHEANIKDWTTLGGATRDSAERIAKWAHNYNPKVSFG